MSVRRFLVSGDALRRLARRRASAHSERTLAGLAIGVLFAVGAAVACGDAERRVPAVGVFGSSGAPGVPDRCDTPNESCPCETEGARVECGRLTEEFDDYVTCQVGQRTCENGEWGKCQGSRVTVKSKPAPGGGVRPQALGTSMVCPKTGPDLDPCDPYCNVTSDTPEGVDAGDGFSVTDGGVTLAETADAAAIVPCTTLTLTANPETVTVTRFDPVATDPDGPVELIPTVTGDDGVPCTHAEPYPVVYTVDKVDRATASGTDDTDGELAVTPVAGPLTVTAYALGLNASTQVNVRVNVVESPATDATANPGYATTEAIMDQFASGTNPCSTPTSDCWENPIVAGTGTVASTVVWLYPYEGTYFPLGLRPPDVQYTFSTPLASEATPAVKVSLRYPAGASAVDADFNYSVIVRETNTVQRRDAGFPATIDPQVRLSTVAWSYFERTARGDDASIAVQRHRGGSSGTQLEAESAHRTIHFVDGQLKGTLYYNSYNSPIASGGTVNGVDVTGGVLKIEPGAAQPSVAIPGSTGHCTGCHSVSSDGSTLIAASGDATAYPSSCSGSGCNSVCSGALPGTSSGIPSELYRGNSCAFDLTTGTEIATYAKTTVDHYTFPWAGLYPNGAFALTNAWNNMGTTGDRFLGTPQGRAYRASSKLAYVADGSRLFSTGGPNMAVTPSFSHDGTKVAFNPSNLSDDVRDVIISEISPCIGDPGTGDGVVVSELSACRGFNAGSADGNESVEIRNDSPNTVNITGWTIRGGSGGNTACSPAWSTTTCGTTTLSPGASTVCTRSGNCLLDSGTGKAVSLRDATGTVVDTTPGYSDCSSTLRRGHLSCGGTWTGGAAGVTNDTANNTCTSPAEYVELRNEAGQTVDVSGWTFRVGSTTCATVPAGTTRAIGLSWFGTISGDCLPDTGGTLDLYDASGGLVDRHTYESTCSPKTVSVRDCAQDWYEDYATGSDNPDNDDCSDFLDGQTSSAAGNSLRVMTFTNGTTPTFSGLRTVSSGSQAQGYPSFLPDNDGIVFHQQINPSAFPGESTMNSVYGGSAEIWLTASTNTSATGPYVPRRLHRLNGYAGTGSALLQNQQPRHPNLVAIPSYNPDWHSEMAETVNWNFDGCFGTNPQSDTVSEGQLNYFPSSSPIEIGGTYWVLFASRRLYGNVAVSSPWQAERSNATDRFAAYTPGTCNDSLGPASGFLETKKLWIAAVDKDWKSTSGDPSHPAFYFPGQELRAGNSHGYWVASPCTGLGGSCVTNDDCCLATGESPSRECRRTSPTESVCMNRTSCSQAGVACNDETPCCSGLTCPAGGGVCINEPPFVEPMPSYETATMTREYEAVCPEGTAVVWRFFEWQATVPDGTSIDFFVETKEEASGTYEPMDPIPMSQATPASGTGPGTWYRGPQTVDQLLESVDPPLPSYSFLRVTMTFNPNETATQAPTLHEWRQIHDCVPAD